MATSNIRMAWASLSSARWRSLLTMLGIIIGVISVVTTVSLGQGVKQQINAQIRQLGSDLITIRPGHSVNRNANGKIVGVNLFTGFSASNLNDKDLAEVSSASHV